MPSGRLSERMQVLLSSGEPVSFFDAMAVARAARRQRDLSDAEMSALVILHDHPATTDGGREVLAELLRACAERLAAERQRATRGLTLADHDTTVRAPAGAALRVTLPDRRGQGCRWTVTRAAGPIAVLAEAGAAIFTVSPAAAGRAELELTEDTPPGSGLNARHFTLHIVVE